MRPVLFIQCYILSYFDKTNGKITHCDNLNLSLSVLMFAAFR